jgi:hypothetical protein
MANGRSSSRNNGWGGPRWSCGSSWTCHPIASSRSTRTAGPPRAWAASRNDRPRPLPSGKRKRRRSGCGSSGTTFRGCDPCSARTTPAGRHGAWALVIAGIRRPNWRILEAPSRAAVDRGSRLAVEPDEFPRIFDYASDLAEAFPYRVALHPQHEAPPPNRMSARSDLRRGKCRGRCRCRTQVAAFECETGGRRSSAPELQLRPIKLPIIKAKTIFCLGAAILFS